ncbi:MAG TPA: type III restriction endonuclease subunit M [Actinobacteria bacterium]|nr:type III restriction endonuclease subunit M [Actinomycetota bacterium]
MPILDWIGKKQVINHDKEVPFRLLKRVESLSVGESENLIIKGDNLEALKALLPYYYNKVKCIYIDPPYNTGNENWIYNDRVNSTEIKKWLGRVVGSEGEDLSRHDKWLCMMYPRLKLLRELLKDDGGIFISIDYNEDAHLRIVLDEVFGAKNHRNTFVVSRVKKNIQEREKVRGVNFGFNSVLFYAKSDKCLINPPKRLHKKAERWHAFDAPGIRKTMEYEIFGKRPPKGRHWMYSEDRAVEMMARGELRKNPKTGSIQYLLKASDYTLLDTNWTDIQEYDSGWNFPSGEKNVELIKRIIRMLDEPNNIILDSFAGSGTTAHAVLELNKEDKDGGNRKFILVEMEDEIARKVTAERVKRVIKGYTYKNSKGENAKIKGLGGGFQFMNLDTELFNAHGLINDNISYTDLARYIFFSETKLDLKEKAMKDYFIGENNGAEYYLVFKQGKENILNEKIVSKLKKTDKKKVVYADNCTLDSDMLNEHGITFKQIPYEVRAF